MLIWSRFWKGKGIQGLGLITFVFRGIERCCGMFKGFSFYLAKALKVRNTEKEFQ